ncbi:MAG TPA: hypothetical protein VGD62_12405 [Acidobacteriaceae bacterium]
METATPALQAGIFPRSAGAAVLDRETHAAPRSGWQQGLAAGLLQPRQVPGFGLPEALSLALFTLVLAWSIPSHESWFDEAQAWLIARSSTLGDLLLHRLHYEGAPALWHLLLWVEVRAGVSFLGMHVLAGFVAVAGVSVWLRSCPLPRLLCLLAPFTFFLQYQYAVVARTYVLAPLFAYLLMALYQNRRSSPMLFCVVAGLFANCSLHMAAFAGGLVVMYAWDRVRRVVRRGPAGARPAWPALRPMLAPAAVLLVLFAAAAATAVPTADGSSTAANPVVGAIRKSVTPARTVQQVESANEVLALDQAETEPPRQGLLAQYVWRSMHQRAGAPGLLDGRILKHLLVLITGATASISTSNLLAACFLCLLAVNLGRAHLLITLLPWALIEAVNVLVTGEAHHFGLLWIALTCSMWALALEPPRDGRSLALRGWLYACLLLVMVLQIGWSVHAVASDLRQPYSGSRATAAFFAGLPRGERIAAFDDDSVTVNAYLPRSPYYNQRVDYWPFSRTQDPSLGLEQVMAGRPDMVSLKMAYPDHPVMYQWVQLSGPGTVFVAEKQLRLLLADGYHETHRFCGRRFFRSSSESTDCRVIFEPLVPAGTHPGP